MSTTTDAPDRMIAGDLARCDRCGAPARTRYVLPSGRDLVFCGHHGNAYGAALAALHRCGEPHPEYGAAAACTDPAGHEHSHVHQTARGITAMWQGGAR